MPDIYYMRPLHHYKDGQLRTYGDQRGTVTQDPIAAYKRYVLAREKRWQADFPQFDRPQRAGRLFAFWLLPGKLSRDEAQAYARTAPPHRVCVVTEDCDWRMVELVLPRGQEIIIDDYRDDMAAWSDDH